MALAFRELDPRIQYQDWRNPQVTAMNPYAQMMNQARETSTNRQFEAAKLAGEAEAQQRVADVQRAGAWTQGLDAATKGVQQGLGAGMGIAMQRRQQAESEASGQANRAMQARQMEQIGQNMARQSQMLPLELDQMRAGTEATKTQTQAAQQGMQLTEQQIRTAKIEADKREVISLYEQSEAAKHNLPGALPGESVMSYMQRNEAEGKIANTQQAKAQAGLTAKQLQFADENQRLNVKQTLASIRASDASAKASLANADTARQQMMLAKEQQQFSIGQAKKQEVFASLDQFKNRINAETSLNPQQKTQAILSFVQDMNKKYGADVDADIALGYYFGKEKSDASAAKAAEIALANVDPVRQVNIQHGIRQAKIATAGAELLSMLDNEAKAYSGAGRIWNDQNATESAARIQAMLDRAGAEDPLFAVYANQFRNLNKGIWAGGFEGISNFKQGPQQAYNALRDSIAKTIQTNVKAVPTNDPLIQNLAPMINAVEKRGNIFFRNDFYPQSQNNTSPIAGR